MEQTTTLTTQIYVLQLAQSVMIKQVFADNVPKDSPSNSVFASDLTAQFPSVTNAILKDCVSNATTSSSSPTIPAFAKQGSLQNQLTVHWLSVSVLHRVAPNVKFKTAYLAALNSLALNVVNLLF